MTTKSEQADDQFSEAHDRTTLSRRDFLGALGVATVGLAGCGTTGAVTPKVPENDLLDGDALDQAALGVADGGLGFRRASRLAVPAFVASRVESRPFVKWLFDEMTKAGVDVPGAMAHYDQQTGAVLNAHLAGLSPGRATLTRNLCEEAAAAATERLAALLRGDGPLPTGPPVGAGHAAERLVDERGAEDDEHPASRLSRGPRLLRKLMAIIDEQCLEGLRTASDGLSIQRLRDLADPTTSAEWLWALGPEQPAHLESEA